MQTPCLDAPTSAPYCDGQMDKKEYRLAAVMFTDIVGFSRMMERDEAGTLDLLSTHNRLVRETVDSYGGRVIKTIGDAFLCEFSNTVNAVKCAAEIQEAVGVHNEADPKLPLCRSACASACTSAISTSSKTTRSAMGSTS